MSEGVTRSMDGGTEPTRPTAPAAANPRPVVAHAIPARIGRYTIKRVLGEGGMGTVYEAQQESPKRAVALKVIRVGYLSPQLLKRFEHESAVLGRLQHPGIAQVYEAGTVQDERGHPVPFFAMEFIRGVPLTEYAAQKHLGTRERLDLIARICDAVYHAHQKGVIHRDLKPANILVDESGQPKILDFGIARATDSDIQQTTLQTDIGQLIGTVPYMSPEQVGGDPDDLDTRSDVYALGVIAYELLAGRLPYELQRKAIHEAARIIREEEPTRLSSINRTLRGDVETIVAKALEKEKARRYQSAESLASDIRRYLKHEPIAARPASTWYQVAKFSRRNRALVGGVIASFMLLVAGVVTTAWQARLVRDQRDRAFAAEKETSQRAEELRQVSEFQAQMLSQVDPTTAGVRLTEDVINKFDTAMEKADVSPTERHAQVEGFRQQWRRVNATDAARELIDRTILRPAVDAVDKQFKDQPIVEARLRQVLADRYRELGLYDAALPLQESALATRRRELGGEHVDTLNSIHLMGLLLKDWGRFADAEPYYLEALEMGRRVMGEESSETLTAIYNMGILFVAQDRLSEAEPYLLEAMEKRQRVLGEEHPETIESMYSMGTLRNSQGRAEEAERYYRRALAGVGRLHRGGRETAMVMSLTNNLGSLLLLQRRLTEAEPYLRETLNSHRSLRGEDHPATLGSLNNLAGLLQSQGRLVEAEAMFREVVERSRRVLGEGHINTLISISNLGRLLQDQGKFAEAEPYCREALEQHRRALGDEHLGTLVCATNVGLVLCSQGKFAEAAEILASSEPAARRVFTGLNELRLSLFLLTLGKARAGIGEFGAAESNVLEAYSAPGIASGSVRAASRDCIQTLLNLYTAWHATEPGNGYDAKAAEWKAKLDAITPPVAPETETSKRPEGG